MNPSWKPTYDFIYFTPVKRELRSKGGIIQPGADNDHWAQVLAVGPGRLLPNGALRLAPCEPGDYILINAVTKGVVTEFFNDDGELVYCMEGSFIIGTRKELPAESPLVTLTGVN